MVLRPRNRPEQREGGFTLIELLVVIVILGILSAVVVFAVRGTGDKGKAAAGAIDARTLRTAEETYCARFGKYGTGPELQAQQLLSNQSSLNDIRLTTTGSCGQPNSLGAGYVIAGNQPVSMSVNFSPGSLDPGPPSGGGSWQLVQMGIGETLTRVDRQGKLQPWLATAWTNSADFKTWTFTLQSGVQFFDGVAMDANAVVGALTRNTTNISSARTLLNAAPGGITAPDAQHVQIVLNGPDPALDATVSQYNFVIYNANNLAQISTSPSLTGAFKPTAFTPGVGLNLVRNDSYWGEKALAPSIQLFFQTDGNTRSNSLLSGQADLAYQVPYPQVPVIKAKPGFQVKAVTSGYEDFMTLNTTLPQFSDKIVRQALSEALDRSALAALDGNQPAFGPISTFYTPYALTSSGYAFNKADAATKLDAQGWTCGGGSPGANTACTTNEVRQKAGVGPFSFTLIYYNNRPELVDMVTVIQQELAAVGVAANPSQVPCCARYSFTASPPLEAGLYANNTEPTGDPESFFNPFYTGNNQAHYGSTLITNDLATLSTTVNTAANPTARNDLVRQIQQDMLSEAPYLFLTVPVFQIGVDTNLSSYVPYPSDYYVVDNQVVVAR